MTVRFKSRSEYQKSYGESRSRSLSPQRCAPLAGLRSDHMGICREPGLQRRKRPGPGGLAQSCTSLLGPSDPPPPLAEPKTHRKMPGAASRHRSAPRKDPSLDPSLDPGPPTPPERRAEPESPSGSRTVTDSGPAERPRRAADSGPAGPGRAGKPVKPHPPQPDSQPQPSRPLTAAPDGQQLSANEVDHALRWRAGLRSGGQRSEYHRQFSWKKPAAFASPMLNADQVLFSSHRSIPPFKKNPVSMETEYRRSFRGGVTFSGPRLRKHLEHQRVPLFHTHMTNRKRREEAQRKLRPDEDATPPSSPQVQRGHRMLTEYQSSFRSPLYRIPEEGGATDGDAPQVRALRQQAAEYRRRAWGINFSREHLSQLQSEHNALWEPTDTTESDPPTPHLTFDLCRDADSRATSCVAALDLASHSSRRSSVVGSGDTNKNTQTKTQTRPGPPQRRTAWGGGGGGEEEEEEEEEGNTEGDEGRLPTPKLKIRPVQRTHHDLTTPATGGAILVGKLKNGGEDKQQGCGSSVSMVALADTVVDRPVKLREVWSEDGHTPSPGPSPSHKPASRPIRTKQAPPSPVAPPPLVPAPLHGIQGMLRHPDFQHNGDLGLRFREQLCPGGGCGSDDDDRLSVMSYRSAASCSVASAVLERAQKRRENFWGKR